MSDHVTTTPDDWKDGKGYIIVLRNSFKNSFEDIFEKVCTESSVQQTHISVPNGKKSSVTRSQKLCNSHYVDLLLIASRIIFVLAVDFVSIKNLTLEQANAKSSKTGKKLKICTFILLFWKAVFHKWSDIEL